ncbi:phage tail tube protein [Nitratidesulfovibrio sp. 1201_IL3209]|uniref:phage tail tube protein n=1 Tax=Nitratidesulfovibrio sp. 1201_IL3209 TaxID=3084053 RepID=UPI002FD9A065
MAKRARGYQSTLVLGFEDDYRIPPETPAGILLPFNTNGLKSSREKNTPATIFNSRNPVEPFDGNTTASGDIVVPLDAEAFGWWLAALFGAPVTTGASAPYSHVFKVPDEQPSFWVEKKLAIASPVYPLVDGVKVASMSISAGGSGEATASITCEGANETMPTSQRDASPVVPAFDRFSNFMAALKVGGTEVAVSPGCTLELGAGLDTGEDNFCLGGGGIRGDLPEGIMSVSGTARFLFTSGTFLDMAMNGTETSLELKWTKGAKSLSLMLNELQFARNTPAIEGPQGVSLELPFQAYHRAHAANSVIVATLVNNTASYAIGA